MPEIILNRADFSALACELLENGHVLRFRAHGDSMRPFIQPGDILQVRPLEGAWPRPGQVLLYRRDAGQLIAHRFIGYRSNPGKALLLRGDTICFTDEWIGIAQVIGRVIAFERAGRVTSLAGPLWRSIGLLWGWLLPLRRKMVSIWQALKVLSDHWGFRRP
jgi:hypothetical protein